MNKKKVLLIIIPIILVIAVVVSVLILRQNTEYIQPEEQKPYFEENALYQSEGSMESAIEKVFETYGDDLKEAGVADLYDYETSFSSGNDNVTLIYNVADYQVYCLIVVDMETKSITQVEIFDSTGAS